MKLAKPAWLTLPVLIVAVATSYLTLIVFDLPEARRLAAVYAIVQLVLALGNLWVEGHERRSP